MKVFTNLPGEEVVTSKTTTAPAEQKKKQKTNRTEKETEQRTENETEQRSFVYLKMRLLRRAC